MGRNNKPKESEVGGRQIGGIPINTLEDYKAETALVMDMIDIVNDIQANVFLVCHVVVWTNQDMRGTSKTKRQILTGGKKATALLPTLFSEIWHFQKKDNIDPEDPPSFTVLFDGDDDDIARTALGIPGPKDITSKGLYKTLKPYLNLKLKEPKQHKETD